MPLSEDHLYQAKRNIQFLEKINRLDGPDEHMDWQVTACFYVAVHLVNAHLAGYGMQYRKHVDVGYALNPYNKEDTALPFKEYTAYEKLQGLSRRSRYLVPENAAGSLDAAACYCVEGHLAKAFRYLNVLMVYFNQKNKFKLKPVKVKCAGISRNELTHINVQNE
ncbi:hypothetical protein GA0116948_10821 [Chitinophaga costaii]|uniref:HEPN domain-containing protein n=1 Tax=Chitinophaga costaii TaxID=1335309 RepID=A0A1C4ED34_9BACT|nr:hypothetical protein [Chitinophaga costaii]PUZ23901.1 hypothetical protein DCM91_14020 [Chitinophaga costaii]SCC41465.1 hypothetical protein GA0116948_10821 [Chitinophaga costaii]